MNKKQYNNVIENTLKHEQTDDSLSTARAIFDNMGVALPQGDMKTVYETIKTDNYMGWKSCTMQEAQAAADNGTAAIGISEDKIVVLSANDDEQLVAQTASVMTLDENTYAFAVEGMQYYSYGYGTTNYNSLYFSNSNLEVSVGWTGYNVLYGSGTSTAYWTTSNSEVIEVDYRSGYLQAVGVGSAWITATTSNGYSAEFYVNVSSLSGICTTEKTIFGAIIDDIIGAQAYRVKLNLFYNIDKIKNGKVYLGQVSAFTKYDKGNMAFGLDYPDISIGELTIGNDTYAMQDDTRDLWLSPNWKWDSKIININKWYDIGTTISTLSIVMLDATLFPYRSVEIQGTLQLD